MGNPLRSTRPPAAAIVRVGGAGVNGGLSTFGNTNLVAAILWREASGMISTEVPGKEDSTC